MSNLARPLWSPGTHARPTSTLRALSSGGRLQAMIKPFAVSIAIVALIAVSASAQKKPEERQSAAELFDFLPGAIHPRANEAELEKLFLDDGLRKTNPDPPSWEMKDSSGLLRIAQLLDGFWSCVFFPAARIPIAGPLLDALARSAESTKLTTDRVELEFPSTQTTIGGKTVTRTSSAAFEGAIVVRRVMTITWAP